MPRPIDLSTFLTANLDPASRTPLSRQLYDELKTALGDGRLPAGTRLPSTRALAEALGLSRNTVLAAFDQLAAEGAVIGRRGGGTRVAPPMPELEHPEEHRHPPRLRHGRPDRLSVRGKKLAAIRVATTPFDGPVRPFRPGVPAYDAFPADEWRRRVAEVWERPRASALGYADPAGSPRLREAIAAHARAARAVVCDASQVLVVSGSQQGLDLAARMLLDEGDTAWIEDPGYVGARAAMVAAGAHLVPVPVDDEGMDVARGIRKASHARLAYVTPSHQYPRGSVLSRPRREALLAWARRHGAWIVEDDYDSEYRHVGWPLPSLQGMDGGERVLYLGTFSKTMFPAIRVGYLIVPRPLAEAFARGRAILDRQPPGPEQDALASLLEDGGYARHLRRMRTLYGSRRQALLTAAATHLNSTLELQPAETGMHLLGLLPGGVDDRKAAAAALAHGVESPPLSGYALTRPRRGGLVLGYAGYDEAAIEGAACALGEALREVCR